MLRGPRRVKLHLFSLKTLFIFFGFGYMPVKSVKIVCLRDTVSHTKALTKRRPIFGFAHKNEPPHPQFVFRVQSKSISQQKPPHSASPSLQNPSSVIQKILANHFNMAEQLDEEAYLNRIISDWLRRNNTLNERIDGKFTSLAECMLHLMFSHFNFTLSAELAAAGCSITLFVAGCVLMMIALLVLLFGYLGMDGIFAYMKMMEGEKRGLTKLVQNSGLDGNTIEYLTSRFQWVKVKTPSSLVPLRLLGFASLSYGFFIVFVVYQRYCG